MIRNVRFLHLAVLGPSFLGREVGGMVFPKRGIGPSSCQLTDRPPEMNLIGSCIKEKKKKL